MQHISCIKTMKKITEGYFNQNCTVNNMLILN